jgi:hypothetical protein
METASMRRHGFEMFPGRSLHLFFFTEVTNGDEILAQIRAGTLEMAFLSPSLVSPPCPQFNQIIYFSFHHIIVIIFYFNYF